MKQRKTRAKGFDLQERVWAIKCERAARDGLPEAAWQVPSEFIERWKTTRTQAEAG